MNRVLKGAILQLRLMSRRRNGAMAAEFALISPVLFSLILGAFEFGTVMLAFSDLQLGANVMARQLAVNDIEVKGLDTRMSPMMPPWVSATPSIQVQVAPGVSPGHELVTVTVELDASSAVPLSIFTRVVPLRLRAASTAVRELVYEG